MLCTPEAHITTSLWAPEARAIAHWPVLYAGWILQNAGGGTGFLLNIPAVGGKKKCHHFLNSLTALSPTKRIFVKKKDTISRTYLH